jgi:hypothetical protein
MVAVAGSRSSRAEIDPAEVSLCRPSIRSKPADVTDDSVDAMANDPPPPCFDFIHYLMMTL